MKIIAPVTLFSLGLDDIVTVKSNLSATIPPTANDDVLLGYEVGSRWVDIINDNEYVCLDASEGVALWEETTTGEGSPTLISIFGYKEKLADYAVLVGDDMIVITDTSIPRTITLPDASTVSAGKRFLIKDGTGGADNNTITVSAQEGQMIDGNIDYVLQTSYACVSVVSNGVDKYYIY